VSQDAIGGIIENVVGELAGRVARPWDPIYPEIFVDAIVAKRKGRGNASQDWPVARPGTVVQRSGVWPRGHPSNKLEYRAQKPFRRAQTRRPITGVSATRPAAPAGTRAAQLAVRARAVSVYILRIAADTAYSHEACRLALTGLFSTDNPWLVRTEDAHGVLAAR
jgi:hypothetical protein